jgi:hypothetical protein
MHGDINPFNSLQANTVHWLLYHAMKWLLHEYLFQLQPHAIPKKKSD